MDLKAMGFAALAFAGLASPALAAGAAAQCNITLAVTDEDPKGLNVRSAPSTTASIVAVLKGGPNDDYIEVHVTGQSGDWYSIDQATLFDNELPTGQKVLFKGHGFVHESKVGASGLEGGSLVYDKPDKSGKPLAWDQGTDEPVKVLGCSGVYARIQGKKAIGWSKEICTNMLTTCV